MNANRLDAFVSDGAQESNVRTFTPIAKKTERCYNKPTKEKVQSGSSAPKTPRTKKKKTRIVVEELF